jgi:predicted MFS family arabinose efflux permease
MEQDTAAGEGRGYRYYVLAMLTVTAMFSIVDRLILSILLQDIKTEFRFTDTQIGLITGIAFTLFYVVFSIPLGWIADHKNRKTIVAICLAGWSAMTAFHGAAVGFWSLFLCRIGVGIGEAGSGPASSSLLADYFQKHELAKAFGILTLGATAGTGLGLMTGGFIADIWGWRMAFVVLGVPGIVLAGVLYLTIREPERGRYAAQQSHITAGDSWRATMASLARNTIYVRVTISYALLNVIGYAMVLWLAAIMIRNFGLSTGDIGLYLGLAFIIGGIPGPILGGLLGDILAKRDPKWRAWLPAIAGIACLPIYFVCVIMTSSFWPFLALFCTGYFIFLFATPSTLALMQLSVGPNQRASALAIAMLVNNLVGQAIGAFLVGSLSDALAPAYGIMSLNYAVIAICMTFGVPGAIYYVWTASAIERDKMISPQKGQ